VNFASQEYLNLATHPEVRLAAKEAIDIFGVHSAGSAALMGNTRLSLELEKRLAAFLGYKDCTVFPTGWGAGYGLVKTLVRQGDHVIIDRLAHACLQEGARAATGNVHLFPHLSNAAVGEHLRKIRQKNPTTGILVVSESLFSMDSDVPQIEELQDICSCEGATLMIDVAHDAGATGPAGGGYLELQCMAGKVDIVMGSFSKSFGSNGGFVACNDPALKLALRYNCGPLTFTNALSPVQAATVLKSLEIIEGEEGRILRERLMTNVLYMRERLTQVGLTPLGLPSAIVPVVLGTSAYSRLATRYAYEMGALVNLVEFPAVARGTSRWRIQVMANHTAEQIDRFVRIAEAACEKANEHLGATEIDRIDATIAAE
jgi:glycine C-acetyltransferase